MQKKTLLLLTAFVMLASSAFAAVVSGDWGVTIKASPANSATVTGGVLGKNPILAATDSKDFTVTPKEGYEFTKVLINGVAASLTDSLSPFPATFTKSATPAKAQTFTATLAVRKFTVATTPDEHVTFAPAQAVVKYGTRKVVKITPKKGYQIYSVTDGPDAIPVYATSVIPTPPAGPAALAKPAVAAGVVTLPSATPVYVILENITDNHTLFVSTQTNSPVHAMITPSANQALALNYFTNGGTLAFDASSTTPADATYAWSVSPKPVGTTITPTTADSGKTATFTTTTAGLYAITLTASKSGINSTSTAYVQVNDVVSAKACSDCHSLPTQYSDFASSPHASSTHGAPTECDRCHNSYITSMADVNTKPINICETCHTGQYGKNVGTKHADSTYFVQNRCAMCHNPHSTTATFGAGSVTGCQACHTPGKSYSIYSSNLVGKAPHFRNFTAQSRTAYAYVQNPTNSNSLTCSDCHGHNNDINAGWGEGAHGDLSSKWNHFGNQKSTSNFKDSPGVTSAVNPCSRCHTAKGFAQFVESGFTAVSTVRSINNTVAPLACTGCHSSAEGKLRLANFTTASNGNKGYVAYVGYSTATMISKKIISIEKQPDFKNSNICMPCHTHRSSSVGLLKAQYAANGSVTTFKFYSANPVGQHDYQVAGTVANTDGYTFTSAQTYVDRMKHMSIGVNNYKGTGNSGPCVSCHMSTDGKTHNLEAVTIDKTAGEGPKGVITGIPAGNKCATCHPSNFTYQDVNAKKLDFNTGVRALAATMVKAGLATWNATGTGITIRVIKDPARIAAQVGKSGYSAEKNAGVIYNYNMLSGTTADAAAYVHNPALARKLVFDSIDYLDDGIMNNTAAQTIQNLGINSTARGFFNTTTASRAAGYTTEPGCLGCHLGSGTNSNSAPGIQTAPHYNTTGALVSGQSFTQAQFVVPGTQCNYCHGIGHGTDSPKYSATKASYPNVSSSIGKGVLKEYAESGHGEINAAAWADYDFKARATCNVCHTTNGYVAAMTSANANSGKIASAPAWYTGTIVNSAAVEDTTKQVLACNTCHSSTNWKNSVRNVTDGSGNGYVAGMGGFGLAQPAYITYPDVGTSNVCITCHASRENGASVNASAANFANTTFKNPHYLAAAAVFYGKGGFQFYTSGVRYNTYGAAGKVGRNANWSHGKLGMDNFTTASLTTGANLGTNLDNTGKVRGSGNKGQCVACHLGPANTHTYGAFDVAKATWGTNSTKAMGCYGCHSGENMEEVAVGEKAKVDRALDLLAYMLEQYGLFFNNDKNPYFFTDATYAASATNWTNDPYTTGTTSGKQTMGAAMNLKLLKAEKGSHVHNRNFMRALIADSIVYLQNGAVGDRTVIYPTKNGVINFSNYSTAVSAPNTDRLAGKSGSAASVNDLKSYLTKSSGGGYIRR